MIRPLLIASLALNVGILGVLIEKRLSAPPASNVYRSNKIDQFTNRPPPAGSTVLLGDSLFALMDVGEVMPGVVNRALSGNTVSDVTESLPPLEGGCAVILVGINDLQEGRAAPDVIARYRELLVAMPASVRVGVMPVLPVNAKIYDENIRRGSRPPLNEVAKVNAFLASQSNAVFLETRHDLVDEKGELAAENTIDGLHLNSQGIDLIARAVSGFCRV